MNRKYKFSSRGRILLRCEFLDVTVMYSTIQVPNYDIDIEIGTERSQGLIQPGHKNRTV